MPKEFEPAPLSEQEIANRPAQLANALSQIQLAEQVIAQYPNHEYTLEGCRDGKPETLIVDAQVIQGMKGGAARLWKDVHDNYNGLAERTREAYVPAGYRPQVVYRRGRK